ncbi:MAG: alpha/beta hydrolase fold domain-containing protein [Gemmobacter sp.]|nr:alpha/beta hydrolase fold domain-containing protein [Gemmobacter sp.]
MAVAGDSAGANLATITARRLRGRVALAVRALLYPVTDCDFATASYHVHGKGLPLTAQDMRWFFEHYAPSHLFESPDIACLRAQGLTGMPPAVVVTAEYEVLADEGASYAERLRAADVAVTLRQVQGVTHGFIRLHNLFDGARL